MTRRMYIIGGVVIVTIITALILIIVNLSNNNEPTEEAINFCEAYPETLFCQDENAESMAIAKDLFAILDESYTLGYTEEFCDSFFYGNLQTYCKDNPTVIFPSDFYLLRDEYTIREVEPNIFDIRTQYTYGTRAYTFRMALNDSLGLYSISGFSFEDWEAPVSLELTDEDINDFMVEMIEESENPNTFFCHDYFAYEGNEECSDHINTMIPQPEYVFNYQIEEIGINRYNYFVTNEEDTATIGYRITIEEFEGSLYLTEFESIAAN